MRCILPIIAFSIIVVSCKKLDKLDEASSAFVFTISDTAGVRADGYSVIHLNATVPPQSKENMRKIIFTAPTLGTFLTSSTLLSDTSGKVTTAIRVGIDSGYHLISASIENTTVKKEINYFLRPAKPDTLLIDANKSIADTTAGSSVTFTVYLKRNIGYVSKGATITASAYQVRNGVQVAVGRLETLVLKKSDANGTISFNYFTDTGDFDNSKIVTIEVSSINDANQTIRSIYRLKIK